MYLLKPCYRLGCINLVIKFTFHYVSIKTQGVIEPNIDFATFTFHYVSIKTAMTKKPVTSRGANLHSTMYLLKLSQIQDDIVAEY